MRSQDAGCVCPLLVIVCQLAARQAFGDPASSFGTVPSADDAPPPSEVVHLSWDAPASCPSREEALAAIRRLTRPNAPQGEPVVANVILTPVGNGWSADVAVTRAGRGTSRTLQSDSCSTLAQTATLLIALALDSTPLPSSPEPVLPPHSEPSPPRETAEAPPRAFLSGQPLVFGVSAGAVVQAGVLRTAAFAPSLGVWVETFPLHVELNAQWFVNVTQPIAADPTVSSTFGLWSLSLRPCFVAGSRSLRPAMCIGIELGQLSATVAGADVQGLPKTPWWVAMTPGAEVVWQWGQHWALSGSASLLLPIARPTFSVRGVPGDPFELGAVGVQAGLGGRVAF